jgi:phytanoyl-CoA hydroxylase
MKKPPYFNAESFSGITSQMLSAYESAGVLVLENMFSPENCEALMSHMGTLVDGFKPDQHKTIFSTLSRAQEQEDYFLSSGGEIRFFFEDKAFDAEGNLVQPMAQSLNKVGHALHDRDPVFNKFSRQDNFRLVAEGLGQAEPLILQSMYIFKPPHIGGEVVCHQDSTFIWTEPQSCLGLWVALEDATLENGCLWGIPNQHHEEKPRSRLQRKADNPNVTQTIELDSRPWPEENRVALPVPQGTLIAFSGLFPHLSSANTSDKSRHAYTLHTIDGACHYPKNNWLIRDEGDPIKGF